MRADKSVLEILEFNKALDAYKSLLASGLGVHALENLITAEDFDKLVKRFNLLNEFVNLLDAKGADLSINSNLELVTPLFNAAKTSGVLSGEELLSVRALLTASNLIRDELNNLNNKFAELENLRKRLRDFAPELDALKVIEDSGRLADNASQKLFDIRAELDALKKNGRRTAQRLFEDNNIANMLQERVLTWRGGRFLVLVKQEYINKFPGLALERSGSGNSVYMEPRVLSSVNNSLMMKSRDERDEEHRILAELTRKILSRDKAISEAENVLGILDLLNACYELVRVRKNFIIPEIVNKPEFNLVGARHPVLKDKAVPVDVYCGVKFNNLVITGPNTGGKTVVLKTVGVLVILTWLGLPVPARDGTKIGSFDNIYEDIGDEQSIEQNLSTFSSHLKKIIYILKNARKNSLILLDELGAGTDPQEGAALGVAILETLRQRGSITLSTTHHNAIKQYALTTQGVETASMEFDAVNLKPVYKLLMGVPGRSNALMIAKRYGMPESVLKLAQNSLDQNDISAEDIMAELNERRAALDKAELKFKNNMAEAERLKQVYKDRVAEIDNQRDKIINAADKKAEILLRRAEETSRGMMNRLDKIDKAVKNAAREQISGHSHEIKKIRNVMDKHFDKRVNREIENKPAEFKPEVGLTVQVAGSGIVGLIESMDKNKAVLAAGGVHVEVPVKNLLPTEKKAKAVTPVANSDALMKIESVPLSIMVRGMLVGEAMPLVETYLDRAYRAHYSSVTVIHGRGEGILRREVHALCERLLKKYVKSYRLGGEGEGGFGVTIVEFKS
ncbi:MAG: Smr/MutS family protein [Synergistaceae bacterium]|nr:Smr/MutS family protein [Synergistaceae bacterium]